MNDDERLSEIENRISTSRRQLDATLREIEYRLEPEHLMNQGLEYLRHSAAREFASNLGTSVKQNPLPLTFVAVGMAWLMLTGSRSGIDTGRISAAAESMSEGARRARETASDAAHGVRERASQSADVVRDTFERARSGYRRVREQQPLALGAVGLAIGAAMAMALPRTRSEDEWMGDASDRVVEKVRETGREQMERASDVAAAAGEAAVEEASRRSEAQQRERDSAGATESAVRRESQRPSVPPGK